MDAIGAGLTIVTAFLGGVIWLIRLEGRVNTHEAECSQRQKRADERHGEMTAKLTKIDEKLDRLIEHRP